MRECFFGSHSVPVTHENVLGVLSLIIYSLVLIISIKYVMIEMMRTSDQRISDSSPMMFASVTAMPCSGLRHSRNAYSGLVPMSPKTTPSAEMTSLRELSLRGSAAAAGDRACMGRALYRKGSARSGFSPACKLLDD